MVECYVLVINFLDFLHLKLKRMNEEKEEKNVQYLKRNKISF